MIIFLFSFHSDFPAPSRVSVRVDFGGEKKKKKRPGLHLINIKIRVLLLLLLHVSRCPRPVYTLYAAAR